jgi:hypothetical protein
MSLANGSWQSMVLAPAVGPRQFQVHALHGNLIETCKRSLGYSTNVLIDGIAWVVALMYLSNETLIGYVLDFIQ